jgi:hypothetical protein
MFHMPFNSFPVYTLDFFRWRVKVVFKALLLFSLMLRCWEYTLWCLGPDDSSLQGINF